MPRKIKFKAELKQLMDIIIHSLYSHKEIFLRELISNASDAIDSHRFQALTDRELAGTDADYRIVVRPDEEAGTLRVEDNGIGMTREEITVNLGTLARSGTREFLAQLKTADSKDHPELIGQFGVGFYSSFMVTSEVTVQSLSAQPGSEPVEWRSSGDGEFSVGKGTRRDHGTEVVLTMSEEGREYLQRRRIEEIVRKFSDFIEHPVMLVMGDGEETVLNRRKAIWLRPQSEVSEDEYAEFYKHLTRDSEDPARIIHFVAEGLLEYRAILFVSAHVPLEMLWSPESAGLQLYVRRVFITDDFDKLLPGYLRFVRGVVDSSDLPLNVSREMLQQNAMVEKINRGLTNKVLSSLEELRTEDRQRYVEFFQRFGPILKEGVSADFSNREKIAALLMYESSRGGPGEYVSLDEYVEAAAEGQREIYYLLGENAAELAASPYLESLREAGREVLFFTDPVDEFVTGHLIEYKGLKFRAADRGELDGLVGEDGEGEQKREEFEGFLEFLADKLPEVESVRLSSRLRGSASCLVTGENALGPQLERLMRKLGRDSEQIPSGTRTLELNPKHPVVAKLREQFESGGNRERVADWGRLLYEQAVIAEGSRLPDPASFAERVNRLLLSELEKETGRKKT
ncbi:MAG: molecular chaperone HtpG [Candidatus Glassbacteria bacterium]|nr:molecular chaperone HtpG [Candidatus Glassbacteria bacterium]